MSNNKLTLSVKAKDDIAAYIKACDYEIGGFGYVTMDDDGNFYVDQVFLVKQTVSGTHVDFLDEGLAYAIDKAAKDDRLMDLKFCWHSHVEMSAFWSNTDDTMISGMNNGMTPYIVSLVQNKKGEHEQRVDFFNPTGDLGKMTDQITYDLDLYHAQSPTPDHIEKAMAELVTIESQQFYSGYGGNWHNTTVKDNGETISDKRAEFLMEKVAKKGANSLTYMENRHYEILIMRLAEKQKQLTNGQLADWNEHTEDVERFMRESGYLAASFRNGDVLEWYDAKKPKESAPRVTAEEAEGLYTMALEEQHEIASIMTGGM